MDPFIKIIPFWYVESQNIVPLKQFNNSVFMLIIPKLRNTSCVCVKLSDRVLILKMFDEKSLSLIRSTWDNYVEVDTNNYTFLKI